MTEQIIRRFGSVLVVMIAAFSFAAFSPATSSARRHVPGRGGRSAHSASHHKRAKRFAKLSKKHHVRQHPLTSTEKQEMIEKIQSLASSTTVISEDSVVAAQATSPDIQQDIAQAAKEEMAEDTAVDVAIEQFFKARPGALDGESVDPNTAKARQEDFALYDESNPGTKASRSDIMEQIIDWLGTSYKFGGVGRAGVDCSAFTRAVFEKAFGVELPRTAFLQHQLGESVDRDDLQFGDLVFFHTARYSPVSHVGIYVGEGLFANASCSRGVSVASLASPYWAKHYIGGKRLFTNSQLASTVVKQLHQMAADEPGATSTSARSDDAVSN